MNPKDWRTQMGLSLRKVAERLGGRSPMTILRYESGEREAPVSVGVEYRKISRGAVTDKDLAAVRRRYLKIAPDPT